MKVLDFSIEEIRAMKRSPTKRSTARNENKIAHGFHPFGMPLRKPAGETCGSCRHAFAKKMGNTYYKCELMNNTGGPGTDLRLKWPACSKWERKA